MSWDLLTKLQSDEFLSPAAFVLFGGLGLFWFRLMKLFSPEFLERNEEHPLFRRAFERFESRTRLSWMLVVFGAIWLAQAVFQSSWAG